MIGPGSIFVSGPRPRGLRRRTLAYTRLPRRRSRRGKEVARAVASVNHEIVIFDHGPAEFPVAIVRPREPGARARAMVGDLGRWLAARWTWLRPRTIPVVVAAFGMVFVLMSADYLAHGQAQHVAHAHIITISTLPR